MGGARSQDVANEAHARVAAWLCSHQACAPHAEPSQRAIELDAARWLRRAGRRRGSRSSCVPRGPGSGCGPRPACEGGGSCAGCRRPRRASWCWRPAERTTHTELRAVRRTSDASRSWRCSSARITACALPSGGAAGSTAAAVVARGPSLPPASARVRATTLMPPASVRLARSSTCLARAARVLGATAS